MLTNVLMICDVLCYEISISILLLMSCDMCFLSQLVHKNSNMYNTVVWFRSKNKNTSSTILYLCSFENFILILLRNEHEYSPRAANIKAVGFSNRTSLVVHLFAQMQHAPHSKLWSRGDSNHCPWGARALRGTCVCCTEWELVMTLCFFFVICSWHSRFVSQMTHFLIC